MERGGSKDDSPSFAAPATDSTHTSLSMAPFSFGNPSPAPATGGFGGFGAPSTGFGVQPPAPAATAAPIIQVPSLDIAFPDPLIYKRVLEAIKNRADLPTVLNQYKNELLNVHEVQKTPVAPNQGLRMQLQQNPTVLLEGNTRATLQPHSLKEVFAIADVLRVSEVTALALYHKASQFPSPFKSRLCDELLAGSSLHRSSTVSSMAREFYFDQSPSLLLSCRALLHEQLREPQIPVEWVSQWIPSLLQLVKVTTLRIRELLPRSTHHQEPDFLWGVRIPLEIARWERILAAECLFFIAYQFDIGVDPAVSILGVLRELSDTLPVLDPYRHVPDPQVRESGKDKDQHVWRGEWIDLSLIHISEPTRPY